MTVTVSVDFTNISTFKVNERQLINNETFSFLLFINPVIITCAISIVGIGTNIANIVTFTKLGFKETINVSLIVLAVTDSASLLCLLWMSICYNKSLCDLVCDVIDLQMVAYVTGGVPRAYFTIVAGCITAVIAGERCLCVMKPLQVKMMLTRGRLLLVLLCVFTVCLSPILPAFYTTGLAQVFNPETNRSIVTQTHKDHLYQIDFICFGVVMACNVSTYVLVTTFTVIIVWKLASQSQWRARKANKSLQKSSKISNNESEDIKKNVSPDRDKRATMTVTLIAVMYITCFFPGTVLLLTMSLVPEFNKGMHYNNLYEVLWYLAYVGEAICSSANIIIYLKTGTRFREAFLDLFRTAKCTVTR